MEENCVRLAVSWWDKPPLPQALNVYRVVGEVEFENGKAVFRLEQNGNVVRVDTSQLFRIRAVDLRNNQDYTRLYQGRGNRNEDQGTALG